jgi:fumarate hydratase class II
MTSTVRTEKDSLGSEEVAGDRYWGASTERCLRLFQLGDRMPHAVIHAFGAQKKAAAKANARFGLLPHDIASVLVEVAGEVACGRLDDHFPLSLWQTGSGTATNMNVNEVIANRANEKLGAALGTKSPVHPNDHVNMGQSTNDSFGTVMHVAALQKMHQKLFPALDAFIGALIKKRDSFGEHIKIGRTHLQDAAPLRVSDEWNAFINTLYGAKNRLDASVEALLTLPQGGTAVGTGLNAHPWFAETFAQFLSEDLGYTFKVHPSPFHLMSMHDDCVALSNDLMILAGDLAKIANDLRFLSCGPRAGIDELMLPQNEPGSSIMPGKVNPTQIESTLMVCVQVQGLGSAVLAAGSSGQLQLNVMKPLIIANVLKMMTLLAETMNSLRSCCIEGITLNEAVTGMYVSESLMLVTALAPHIGYDKATQLTQHAFNHKCSLKDAARALGLVSEDDFDAWVDPAKMARPHQGS